MEAVWTRNDVTGYEMSTRDPYDLYIIDVRMPVLLGTELAEALKSENPRAKIILLSAFADAALQKISAKIGARLLSVSAKVLLKMVGKSLRDESR
jgi:CheY-like chemotaxis protein